MDNYESFKQFMDDKDVHYTEGQLEHGDRYFRIPQRIKGGSVVNALVIFLEKHIKVVVFGIASIEDANKHVECYRLFNELNSKYSFFKFYLRPNGDVSLEGDVAIGVFDGEFRPNALLGFLISAITLVQDSYSEIMKIQWS